MKCRDAIEQIMKETGTTQTALAGRVGMRGQTNVSEALKRDMKVSLVAKFAEAMGYELVLVKRKPGRKEEGRIVIDNSSENGGADS